MNGFTKHAAIRCQQRGLPPVVIDWLLEFGKPAPAPHGGEIYYFDKRSKKQLKSYIGTQNTALLSRYQNAYLIFNDGFVVTAGHRTKPIRAKSNRYH